MIQQLKIKWDLQDYTGHLKVINIYNYKIRENPYNNNQIRNYQIWIIQINISN